MNNSSLIPANYPNNYGILLQQLLLSDAQTWEITYKSIEYFECSILTLSLSLSLSHFPMATFLRNFNCLAPSNEVSVKILVDEVRNKVLFVQAGKDFVDVLLSFLTLPLGTIARLVSQESNMENVRVGSLSLLYESVANLDKENFRSALEKELLVRPINSMERYCKYLQLNIDDTEKLRSFNCGNQVCIDNPAKRNCKCCEKKRTSLCMVKHSPKNGFVPATATFLISDDLNVKPDNSQLSKNSISLLKYLGCENIDTIKIVTVDVTRKEVCIYLSICLSVCL